MSPEIQFPDEVKHVVSDRNKIWSEFDTARNQAGQLNQIAQKIGDGTATEITEPFTKSNDPRPEIQRVLGEVNTQINELNQTEKEIADTQSQIEQIKRKAQTMTFLLIGAGVVVIIIIFLVLSSSSR